MSLPNIAVLDVDGAVREAEEAVAGDTRASFFRKAAVGGGAVLGSSAIMGMLPEMASAHGSRRYSRKRDLTILNFALSLEYLEAAFYAEAVKSGALSGDVLAFAKLTASHEATHVAALKATSRKYGGHPARRGEYDFQGTTKDQAKFIATAYVLENTGVHAYLGQAPLLKSRALLAAAASIATTEARHAAGAAVLLGNDPYSVKGEGSITPDGPFDTPYSKATVRKAVAATGFVQ